MQSYIGLGIGALVVFGGMMVLGMAAFTVPSGTVGVVQRFGKFQRVAPEGLNWKLPFVETVRWVSLKVESAKMRIETKTRDNVFVNVPVTIQYAVDPAKVYEAVFTVSGPEDMLSSYAYNVILGHVPSMDLDEVFLEQNKIALFVKTELESAMAPFGYRVVKALVTDVEPAAEVRQAMNNINAAQRNQVAAAAAGEAKKIGIVKQAEADAEAKALAGKGIADERKAIIEGLKASMEDLMAAVPGANPEQVMALILSTNYFDALRQIGAQSNTILLPGGAAAGTEIFNALVAAELAGGGKPRVVEPR